MKLQRKEPILNGDTVICGRSDSIKETLDYDFSQEKQFNYKGLSIEKKLNTLQNLYPEYGKFILLVKEIQELLPCLQLNIFIHWVLQQITICLRNTHNIFAML